MKTTLLAVGFAVAAFAAGGYAWQTRQALEETRRGLASANTQLEKAKADLKALQAEAVALKKQTAEQKIALEQMQADLNAARLFVEAERATSARLREELGKMMAMMRSAPQARPAPAALPPGLALPQVAPQRPLQIRIAPGRGATAIGAGRPAQ